MVARRAMLKARDRHYQERSEDIRLPEMVMDTIPGKDALEDLDDYYEAVETTLGRKHRTVAETLVREQASRRVTREVLQISNNRWHQMLEELKLFTARWLGYM